MQINVVKFYSDYGVCEIKKNTTGEYVGLCPACAQHTFCFNKDGQFCCHYCRQSEYAEGAEGNVITYLRDHHGMDNKNISIILEKYNMKNTQAKRSLISCFIEGGYFIIARKIFDSAIWRDNPDLLKLFLYLIGKARHSSVPKNYPGFVINRGELITSLLEIAENNEYTELDGHKRKWSNPTVSRMLTRLQKHNLIKKIKDTYGTHITICNYNTYQNHNNYQEDLQKKSNYIVGGYFIIARKIFDSAIWRGNSHILKLFILLIGRARHSNNPENYNGFNIQRGDLLIKLSEVVDANEHIGTNGRVQKWSKPEVSDMLEKLEKQKLIKIISNIGETHILSVCKYNIFQEPNNYAVKL
ncbi:hypothetical protein BROC_00578 [Candidatus Brocadiaceae bacterium]|nr:hypothetical protein BROC_00578 [Candidatus Brocadiaceae bacterium]